MKLLTAAEIRQRMESLPAWKKSRKTILCTREFKDFPAALGYVQAVARAAEKAWHHPDIDIRWNKVTLVLTTHDAGGLTAKDFDLAQCFDRLAQTKGAKRQPKRSS
ncbi:MAG: 4a-hydroxytetrahydrobiopterin dehydratase [Verrucomicrobiales bacterium]|nr:4a-hydroxytetrahydrobiopterin dehydratase [Verrucomicrobiales bacterium]